MGNIYTVSQVNSYIKSMFAQDFALNKISVKGEISNCKYHPSGHIYFTLKDGGSQIGAVMFSSQRLNLKFRLEEGQQVVVQGTIDVYERDGRYQMYAKEITLEGAGALYERFLALKAELEEMGMFDAYDALTVYFHNFKITPIYPMQQGTYKQEISDIQEDSPIYSSGFRNDTGVEVFGSQTLTNSTTYGAVNTVSGSKSYAYEKSSSVSYSNDLGVFGNIAASVGFSTTEAMEKGWSEEKSESKTLDTSTQASLNLPPYTATSIKQQQKKQKAVTYYKCPVLISYDVTIAVYHQLIQSEYYSSIIARFHGDDARKSLKNRAILNPAHTDANEINWANVKSDDIAKKTINRISQNVLMCSAGGSYTETLITTESKIDELIATRPLAKVVADRNEQKLKEKENFSLNQIKLEGRNENESAYYGFQGKKGTWKMTDADGNTIENENIILSGTKGKQKITVQKAGTYYLTYFIDEDEYNTADHRNQYAANLTVTRPTVKFIVEKVSLNNNADTNNPQINNITIRAISSKIAPGKKIKLTTNLPKSKIKWITSNPKLATVDKNGVVKINKKAAIKIQIK